MAGAAPEPPEVEQPPAVEEQASEPDAAGEPTLDGEPYWEPSGTGSLPSDLDAPEYQGRRPIRRLRVKPLVVYGLTITLIISGILGFGLWMRSQPASPGSFTALAPTSDTAGGNQLAVGGGAGRDDVAGKTVDVSVGENVYLGLQIEPGNQPWQVAPPDPAVLTPVEGSTIPTPGMTLLVFRAVGVGQTVITATSQTDCPEGKQCPNTVRRFQETVVVVPS